MIIKPTCDIIGRFQAAATSASGVHRLSGPRNARMPLSRISVIDLKGGNKERRGKGIRVLQGIVEI